MIAYGRRKEVMAKSIGMTALSCMSSLCGLAAEDDHGAAQRPNIVFLLADDINRDTWGIHGSRDCQTPHIDRLARDGLRFDRAYCAVAMCAPFRHELYTGCSPWRTGTLANHSQAHEQTRSIAHYLPPLGYRVALIGKTHIGPKACYPFEYFADKGMGRDNNALYLEAATGIMDESIAQKKPFCMFIASHDGHAPYRTGDPSAYDADKLTIPPYWVDTPELRRTLVKYYAAISNFDALVGRVRTELESRGLWDNTILMVCSEQGTELPFAKWTCYDNGLHTGLVVHWPGVTSPGAVQPELVSIADIMPTLVEAAGGTMPPGSCDGQSLLPLLTGRVPALHPYVFGAFSNCNIIGNHDRIYPIRVIRNRSFSLIYNPNYTRQTSNLTIDEARRMLADPTLEGTSIGASWVRRARQDPAAEPFVYKLHHRPEYELYNLEQDPYERNNEIDNPAYADTVAQLKSLLHAQLAELGDADPIQTETALVNPH